MNKEENQKVVREMKAYDYMLAELNSGEPVITTIHHENDDTDFRVLTDEECIGVFATWLKKNGYNKKGIGIFLGPDPNLPVIKVEIIEDFDKGIT